MMEHPEYFNLRDFSCKQVFLETRFCRIERCWEFNVIDYVTIVVFINWTPSLFAVSFSSD